jgi:hypothetical protein
VFASVAGFFLNPRAILIFLIPFFPLPASSNSPSNFDDSTPIFSDSMSASETSKLTGIGLLLQRLNEKWDFFFDAIARQWKFVGTFR